MKWIAKSVLALSAFISLPAHGQPGSDQTVQHLFQMCKAPPGDPDEMLCAGYIAGIGDYMDILGTLRNDPQLGMCGRPSYGAMIQAFENWAEKHPEKWATSRVVGVGTALRETWPCVAKNSN